LANEDARRRGNTHGMTRAMASVALRQLAVAPSNAFRPPGTTDPTGGF